MVRAGSSARRNYGNRPRHPGSRRPRSPSRRKYRASARVTRVSGWSQPRGMLHARAASRRAALRRASAPSRLRAGSPDSASIRAFDSRFYLVDQPADGRTLVVRDLAHPPHDVGQFAAASQHAHADCSRSAPRWRRRPVRPSPRRGFPRAVLSSCPEAVCMRVIESPRASADAPASAQRSSSQDQTKDHVDASPHGLPADAAAAARFKP